MAARTVRAARTIGREHELGNLRVGMAADLAVFSQEEGYCTDVDSAHNQVEAQMRLVPA